VGRKYSFDGGDGVRFQTDFTIETTSIDQQIRSQTGVIDIENRGNSTPYIINTTYALTGKMLDDSPMCEPVFGTAVFHNTVSSIRATVTKEENDTYWTVMETTSDDELIEAYFIQTLDAQFYCDFADL